MQQQGLGNSPSIPSRDELEDALDKKIKHALYKDYYSPIFATLLRASPEEKIGIDQIYGAIRRDTEPETKWGYVTDVLDYDPRLAAHIADKTPPADVFIRLATTREGLDRDSIRADTLNRIQKACEQFGEELEQTYVEHRFNHHFEEARAAADGDDVDAVKEAFARRNATDFANEIDTFRQSLRSVAGTANEQLFTISLANHGLTEGEDFETVTRRGLQDLKVHAGDADTLNVEIKSLVVRERADAGLSRIDDPTILCGFFNDATEFRRKVERLMEECRATYLPPETIRDIRRMDKEDSDSTVYTARSDETLFLRANNCFPEDMKYYRQHGELPDRSPGHEREYLS